MTERSLPRRMRLVSRDEAPVLPEIENPRPCQCCHGHDLVASELVIRERRTGRVLKRLVSEPRGFVEIAP